MNFTRIKNEIKNVVIMSGYSRTAKELSLLSDAQLADIGISRKLLAQGGKAFPWREAKLLKIPVSVTNLKTLKIVTYSEEQQKLDRRKAA